MKTQDMLYLSFLFLGLLLILFPVAKKLYNHYQRERRYRVIIEEMNALFANVNPFHISKKARLQHKNPEHLLYGEINLCALLDLLDLVQPKPKDVFYDLGS